MQEKATYLIIRNCVLGILSVELEKNNPSINLSDLATKIAESVTDCIEEKI